MKKFNINQIDFPSVIVTAGDDTDWFTPYLHIWDMACHSVHLTNSSVAPEASLYLQTCRRIQTVPDSVPVATPENIYLSYVTEGLERFLQRWK